MKARVIGGGLAGVEAAYQLLIRGISVDMYEMRPNKKTPAHKSGLLAELVCSNSLKSLNISTSQGLLKKEMSLLNSLVIKSAFDSRVPAGSALAVDRTKFSKSIEKALLSFPKFNLYREEIVEIKPFDIIATGPLSSESISISISNFIDATRLYFYDAVSPIVSKESIDFSRAFYGARYNEYSKDYINCTMSKEEYEIFYSELIGGNKVILKDFEKGDLFSACMPVEEMANRGIDTLRFGPLRPVGFNHQVQEKPWAIVQLRKEDNYDQLYNLVGFQTNLTFSEQRRIFGLIPALKNAEYIRYGVMHRNTYIKSPGVISKHLNCIKDKNIFFAGQILGVEGYMESALTGILAGINLSRILTNQPCFEISNDTMSGALVDYISNYQGDYQPMPANFELIKTKIIKKNKNERKRAYSERALNILAQQISEQMINKDVIYL